MIGKSDRDRAADEGLARRCAGRDEAAWEELYAKYRPVILRAAGGPRFYRLTREDAEDIAVEVFRKLISQIGDYQAHRGSLEAYIYTIARRTAIDRLRVEFRADAISIAEAPDGDSGGPPQDYLIAAVWCAADRLLRQVRSDSEDRRRKIESVVYASIAGDTTKEIADAHAWNSLSVYRIRAKFLRQVRLELEKLLPP